MTQEYYYTDPIAASWMAKHHGVKFKKNDSLRSACEAVGTNGRDLTNGGAFLVSNVNTFRPKIGDIVLSIGTDGDPDMGVLIEGIGDKATHSGDEIIQRDGIAFIWPRVGVIGTRDSVEKVNE